MHEEKSPIARALQSYRKYGVIVGATLKCKSRHAVVAQTSQVAELRNEAEIEQEIE